MSDKFIRFSELVAAVRVQNSADRFFDNFENNCANDSYIRSYYQPYEQAFGILDEAFREAIKLKALAHFTDRRGGQEKQGFYNQLHDAFAYQYLHERGFRNIVSVPEDPRKKTADIAFFDGSQKYCEVKTVGVSDKEIASRNGTEKQEQSYYESLTPAFFTKLTQTIGEARQQIGAHETGGLAFLVIRFDDAFKEYLPTYYHQLRCFCMDNKHKGLVVRAAPLPNDIICVV